MNIIVAKLPKSQIKITVELDDDGLAQFRTRAAENISKKVKIPGFRPGHAPAYVVEGEVGKENFFQEVLRLALPGTYVKAIEENKLEVITRPKITVISESPLKYEAEVAVMPEISVKGYEKIKSPKKEVVVTPEESEEVIMEMRKQRAQYKKKEGTASTGDRVSVDFEGFDEGGASLENTKSKNHPLVIGEKMLVPGFEESLVGMKVEEEKEFTVTFPKDYQHKPFQNKKVKFKVKMNAVEERILPHFDEVFIEMVLGEKRTQEEFKKMVGDDLKKEKERSARTSRENELLESWLKKLKIEIPPLLLEEEMEYLLEQMKEDLQGRGIPWDKYEAFLKEKKRDLKKEQEEEATKRIKIRLMLKKIFELEDIAVDDSKVTAEIERMTAHYPEDQKKKLRDRYTKTGNAYMQLRNQLRLTALFDRFLE